MIRSTVRYGFQKATGIDALNGAVSEIKLYSAKDEGESCAITVLSDVDAKGLSLSVGNCPRGVEVSCYEEHTILIDCVHWPDPLTEFDGGFSLEEGKVKSILVLVNCGRDAVAGDFEIPILLTENGNTVNTFTIKLHIWDFFLPRTYKTAFGLDEEHLLPRFHGFTLDGTDEATKKETELYKAYYDYLLEKRCCAFDLPYDVLDDRADAYMSDPRVTAFLVRERMSRDDGDEMLAKRCEKLRTNPEWLKKAYIYPFDEPTDKETLDKIAERAEALKRICPEIKQVSPFYANIDYDDQRDEIAALGDMLGIMCPKLACFNDDFIYNAAQKERWPSFIDRMNTYSEEGKDIWAYVCWEPGHPYTNVFVNEDGLEHRICFWQQFLCGCNGFLYWRVNYWDKIEDPWTNMATVPYLNPDIHGDGSLLYNGSKVGKFGPCGSVRMEVIRDGIEDCDMLMLASDLLGRNAVIEQIKRVTTNVTHFDQSVELFELVRKEIGDSIEAAMKK